MVTKDHWKNLHKPNSHGCSDKILEFLLHNGPKLLPVNNVIAISANSKTSIPLILRPEICRWSPDFDKSHMSLLKSNEARDLLRTQRKS